MKAVIIAGGKGTRMMSKIPKPMQSIGNKPILQHLIELFKKYDIKKFIFAVGHQKSEIQDFFKDGRDFDVSISYFEEDLPLGTAGALKMLKNELRETFIVAYGDIMIDMNLNRLLKFHRQKKSQCTLVVHPNNHPFDSDLLEIDENKRIIGWRPKLHNNIYYKNLVNAGLYVIEPSFLDFLPVGQSDFGRDVFPKIYDKTSIYGYNTSEYLKDIGTPERLIEVNKDFSTGVIERKSYEHKQRAIFLDRDGVLNEDVPFISRPEDLKIFSFAAESIKAINGSDYLAIVVTNQPVVARNMCSIKELEYIHKKLETELGRKGAKLDAIYYCPHHPHKGYPKENPVFKINCNCRKPKTGLIDKACHEFNIDTNSSYIIGNSEADILCGKNAKLISIGVGDSKAFNNAKPDYFFENLRKAVKHILEN